MNKIIKEPVTNACSGCKHAPTGYGCQVYAYPFTKWLNGRVCPMATNLTKEETKEAFVNPLKASKRKMRGGK